MAIRIADFTLLLARKIRVIFVDQDHPSLSRCVLHIPEIAEYKQPQGPYVLILYSFLAVERLYAGRNLDELNSNHEMRHVRSMIPPRAPMLCFLRCSIRGVGRWRYAGVALSSAPRCLRKARAFPPLKGVILSSSTRQCFILCWRSKSS